MNKKILVGIIKDMLCFLSFLKDGIESVIVRIEVIFLFSLSLNTDLHGNGF